MNKWRNIALTAGLALLALCAAATPFISITEARGTVSIAVWQNRQAQPLEANISYNPGADTAFEKLIAVYSLLEQMRLEHNRQGEIASLDSEKYRDKWAQYSAIFKRKQLALLIEQNNLKQEIVNELGLTWADAARQFENNPNIYEEIFGDREELKAYLTSSTTPLLGQLKAIKLDDLNGKFVDPTEDFTGYTEVDENEDITVTANKCDVDTMVISSNSYVHYDYGASHFGDFEHLLTAHLESATAGAGAIASWWAITETNTGAMKVMRNQDDGFSNVINITSSVWRIIIKDYSDDSIDYYDAADLNPVTYYVTISRSGTTLTQSLYSDASRQSLVDSHSTTVPTTAMRYLEAIASDDSAGSETITYYMADLDLQEGACSPDISNTPASYDFGVITANSSDNTGLTYFIIANSSGGPVNITIIGTNLTGGTQWTLASDGNPGSDIVGLLAGLSGGSYNTTINGSANPFIYGLADSANQSWGILMKAPTSFSDGVAKSGNVTVEATCQ